MYHCNLIASSGSFQLHADVVDRDGSSYEAPARALGINLMNCAAGEEQMKFLVAVKFITVKFVRYGCSYFARRRWSVCGINWVRLLFRWETISLLLLLLPSLPVNQDEFVFCRRRRIWERRGEFRAKKLLGSNQICS